MLGHELSSATLLAMNALKVPLYLHSPENVAVYHSGDIAGVGTSHVSLVLVKATAGTAVSILHELLAA